MKRILSFLLVIVFLAGLFPLMAFAVTPVTSYSSLVAAIAAAPADGTVTTIELENSFSATGGAISIAAGQNIVLTSAAGSNFTFTQATSGQRHFSVAGSLTLQNVTLSGPGGGTTAIVGGVDVSGGTLTLNSGGTITNCRAPGSNNAYYGGGVNVHNGGTLIMNGGTISNNATSWVGGGVLLMGNSTFIMNSGTISGNTSVTNGGGVTIQNGIGTISGGTITGNMATSSSSLGGGISLAAANLTIAGGSITNNRANNGGGIYTDASGAINMSAGTISGNVAAANGGGIYTAQYTTNNPLPPNSYINLIIGSAVIFTNNVAGSGARVPPSNVGTNTRISTTSNSSIFGNPLNNLDINYFGSAGVMVTYLTVTFDPGIGSFSAGTQTQQSVPTTSSPLIPASVPTAQPPLNYGFIGWLATGGSGTLLSSAQVLTTSISNNTTYVAQYAPPITLTFDGQGGTPAIQTVTPVQVTGTYASALLQASVPIRSGYIFRGWFTTPNGSASGAQILPTTIVTTTTNQTLYAWWVPDPTVTITFVADGGSPELQVVSGRVVGSSYAPTFSAVATPILPGYAFVGWFTAESGGTQITASDEIPDTDTTLYAQWVELPTITITYLAQGGTPDGQIQTAVTGDTYGDATPAISIPTLPGYAFVGWFTEESGGTQIFPGTVVTTTTDQDLYAQWVSVTVTITFNAAGGTPPLQVVSGLAPLTSYGPVLSAITTPTQPGFTFEGWHDQPQGMGGSTITQYSLIPPTDSTVYAWWTPNPTITVTFDAQGGFPYYQVQTVTIGTTYEGALTDVTTPTLDGSVFLGWFTTPSGTAGGVQVINSTVVTATANQILYARWLAVTVTLYFDAQGGTPGEQGVTGQSIGDTYASALSVITEPTQVGYTFEGWNTEPDGSGDTITTSSVVPGENTTVYAQWTQDPPVTVTFDSQGGEFDAGLVINGSGETLSGNWALAYYSYVTVGGTFLQAMSATPDPYPPTSGGPYSFGGWWTTPNGDNSGTQVLPSSTVWNPATPGGITLYVHWLTVPTVTLTFDGNGSTTAPATPATQVRRGVVTGDDIDASIFIQTPTRVGYNFIGWFTDPTAGTEIEDTSTVPDTDTTYYAQWAQIPPITVTFDSQGGEFDAADVINGSGETLSGNWAFAYYDYAIAGGTFMQAMSATPNPYPPSNAFTFGGWWTAPDGPTGSGTQVLPTSTVWEPDPFGSITLYAYWIAVQSVTITFDGVGGEPSPQVVTGQFPEDPYSTALSLITTPTLSGFTFSGWEDEDGNVITASSLIPPYDMIVYAQWEPNPIIEVTFDAQGGTPTPQYAYVTTGNTYQSAITSITQPTLAGFLFQGWFTAISGTVGAVQVLYTTVVTATTDQTLYAHWIPDPTITVTFDGNGGDPTPQVVPDRVSGTTFASTFAIIATPTQPGFTFSGWFTSATAGTQIGPNSIIPAGAIPRTLYAHWTPLPIITLTFDAQGGLPTGQIEEIQTGSPYGDVLSDVPDPTMLGNVFAGWFTTENGDTSGVQILDSTIVTTTTDQILFAHWIPLTVAITFDAQGGTPAIQVVPGKVYGDSYAGALDSVATPTRSFYTFLGWFTSPAGGTPVNPSDPIPPTDTTLYAQWAPIPVTLTFDALGAAPTLQEKPAMAGDSFAASLNATEAPVMTGSNFVGWFTQIIGGVQVQPGDIVTQSQTLYARFTATPPIPPTPPTPPVSSTPQTPSTPPVPPASTTPSYTDPADDGSDVIWNFILSGTHYAYLIGEGSGRISPTGAITRAEAASVILRIVSDDARVNYWTLENPFPDVPNNGGAWFSNAVSVANNMGIVKGFPDGTFDPNQHMTRAEVVTVIARFLSEEIQYDGSDDMFPDISGHWARNSINLTAKLGFIQGHPDGTFNPNADITRAEFATIINRILGRTSTDIDTANMRTWVDNTDTSIWYYWAIQIASNSKPDIPYRNWLALQLPNARPGDVNVVN